VNFNLPDNELIEQVQAHQAWAFDALFGRYEHPVRHHLLCIVRAEVASEDLLQETFLCVWTRAEQWTGQGAFKGWLFRIAINLALNHLRTRRRRPEQPLDPPPGLDVENTPDTPAWLVDTASLGPDAVLDQLEQGNWLRQTLHDLPEEQRDVLRLVHQFDLSLRDAADKLGIPSGTVKSRLYYSRQRLFQAWQAWQAEQECKICLSKLQRPGTRPRTINFCTCACPNCWLNACLWLIIKWLMTAHLPRPAENGVFMVNGEPHVVVPTASNEELDLAEIACVGQQLYNFIEGALGQTSNGFNWDESLLHAWLPVTSNKPVQSHRSSPTWRNA